MTPPAHSIVQAPPFPPPAFTMPPGVEYLRTPPAGFSLIGPAPVLDGIIVRAQRSGALFTATAAQPYGDGRAFVNVKPIELQRPVRAPEKALLRRHWKPALAITAPTAVTVAAVLAAYWDAIVAAIATAALVALGALLVAALIGIGSAITSSGNSGHCPGPWHR